MPLLPGKANIGANISELTHHGSRPRSHAQIVAIALSEADRHPHAATGGGIGGSPNVEMRFAAGGGIGSAPADPAVIMDSDFSAGGLIPGATGGRTDRIPLAVHADAHVLPADSVSALGQGGSQAGADIWARAVRGAPWGVAPPPMIHGHGPPRPPSPHLGLPADMLPLGGTMTTTAAPAMHFAHGGESQRPRTSILAAGEELVVPDADVEAIGQRAVRAGMVRRGESATQAGHRLLDEAIQRVREFSIKWLHQAPPPKK